MFGPLTGGSGFDDPGSESVRADRILDGPLGRYGNDVVTILALALAIDYALLVVGRFRDELTLAPDVETAAAALACTLVFPSRFMHSMGWAGVTVALTAVAGSLTLLPALLGFAGHRVNSLRVPPGRGRAAGDGRHWYRLAHAVMRRPLAVTLGVVALLLALGAPFATANWARPGDWCSRPTGRRGRA
ncbi:MMPL family transporter [Actinomadura kijaniata]|uniref:MMPL family transporter n=1 Tax=Actinomadura kijaniata TaxID=46161 RepID=UPI000B263132|nr:MMPL family transporter [Actinomadura kijaniata]